MNYRHILESVRVDTITFRLLKGAEVGEGRTRARGIAQLAAESSHVPLNVNRFSVRLVNALDRSDHTADSSTYLAPIPLAPLLF